MNKLVIYSSFETIYKLMPAEGIRTMDGERERQLDVAQAKLAYLHRHRSR